MNGMEPLFLASAFLISAIAVPFITPYLFSTDTDSQESKTENNPISSIQTTPKEAYIHVCFHVEGVSSKPNVYDAIDTCTNHFLILNNVMFDDEVYDTDTDYDNTTKHVNFQKHVLRCRDELLKDVMFDYEINNDNDLYIRADASEMMYVQGFISDWNDVISQTTDIRFIFLYDDYKGMDQEQALKYFLDAPRVMANFDYGFVNLKYMYYLLKKVAPSGETCEWYKDVETTNQSPESMEIDHVYTNEAFEDIPRSDHVRVEPEELFLVKEYYKKITNACNNMYMSQSTLLWEVMSNVS